MTDGLPRRRPTKIVLFSLADLTSSTADAVTSIRTARTLAQEGYEVVLVAPRQRDSVLAADAGDAAILFHANVRRLGLPNVCNTFVQWIRSLELRCADSLSVFYVRAATFTWLFGLTRWLFGGPKVFSEHHGWFELERQMTGRHRWFARFDRFFQMLDVKFADRVRTVVPGIRDLFVRYGGQPAKICVIGNACNTETVIPVPRSKALRKRGLTPDRKYLGYLGSLTAWQGLDHVMDAMLELTKEESGIDLLIFGDGPERENLARRAEQGGLGGRVKMQGRCTQSEVSDVLGCFDLALLPTSDSGYAKIGRSPLKLREYAAAGKVILAAAIPAVSDLEDEPWLVTYEPGSPNQLAALMARLARDDERIDGAATSARAYAETHFSWASVAQALRTEIETL